MMPTPQISPPPAAPVPADGRGGMARTGARRSPAAPLAPGARASARRRGVGGSAAELHRIVRINEEIKAVVHPAFQINMMALNAILLARRAGDAARGFGVLSGELRGFAVELSQKMEALRQQTSTSVAAVTALVRQGRYVAILRRVPPQTAAIDAQVERVRRRQQQSADAHLAGIAQMRAALANWVGELRPLVQLGIVLARLARVEAAYGGEFAQALTQVSAEFSRTIDQIESALGDLAKATEESGR